MSTRLAWAQSDDERPRRSLVLAGGGMRVAYQAGAIQALFESGLRFSHADGTSGGTINLAMLMSGLSAEEMCERWRTLDARHFVSLMPLHDYLKGAELPAMGSAAGVIGHVFPHLGIDPAKINAARGAVGTFNVCNFSTKSNEAIPHSAATLQHLVAGISLPIVMPAVEIDGTAYTDSVWIKDANVLEAVRRGAEEIWIVWCIGNTTQYRNGPFPQYVHMIEMSANGALFAELEDVALLNARIARGDSPHGQTRPIRVQVVKPEYPLPLDPDYFLGRIDAGTLLAMGYSDAHAALLRAARGEVAPLTSEATRMRNGTPGIAFRQRLSGPFDGGTLLLEGSTCIHDLDRFLEDPLHVGAVYARLEAPGVCAPGICLRGRVSSRDSRSLRYELPFRNGGREWLLEGESEGLGALQVRLHDGGKLVGSARLELTAAELAASVASLHAIHSGSALQSVETIVRFGEFLFGEAYRQCRKRWWQFWK